tara:strand:- start:2145 stop:4208 length:2064 start_codon:yes stop_codon:yes gene_type:complete
MADDLLEDETLVERVHRHYKESTQHTKNWRSDAREDYGFVDGSGQWSENDAQVLRDALRPVLTFNRCGPVIDVVCGQEINNRQEVRYIPREQGDSKVSEILTGAADWVRDQCDAEDEESDAFHDMVVCGMGWTETRMDYDDDLDGAVIIERIDPLEMHWDSGSRKRNLTDSRWMMRVKEFTLKEIKERWPDKADEITGPDALWGDDLDDESPHVTHAGDQYQGAEETTDIKKERMVKVMHHQWWDKEDIWRVADPLTGGISELDQKSYNKMEERFIETGIQLQGVKQKRKIYKQAFIAGEVLLEESDNPAKEGFTYRAMTGKRDRNTNTWFGLLRGMKDPQRWANKWLSQIMHIINSNSKGGLMAEQDAFVNPRKAESEWSDPTSITMFKAGALQANKVMEKKPITYPAGLDKLMEFAVSSIRDVSGVNVDMLGNREGSGTSGVQDAMRRDQGVTILATLFNSLRRYRKEQGRLLLGFIQEYISDGRLVKIIGEEGAQYVPLAKDESVMTYDVIVDDTPNTPNQKEKTFNTLSGLLPALLQAGIPVPPEIIDYAPLPSGLIEKWKETLMKPKGMAPEETAMLQQGVEMLQQENQKLKADHSDKMAKIEADSQAKGADLAHKKDLNSQEFDHKVRLAQAEMDLKRDIAKQDADLDILKAKAQFELKEQEALSKEADRQSNAIREEWPL